MKKVFALLLSSLLICTASVSLTGCSQGGTSSETQSSAKDDKASDEQSSESEDSAESDEQSSGAEDSEESGDLSSEAEEKDDKDMLKAAESILDGYEYDGVVYIEKDGKELVSYASGSTENGEDITIDTPMPVGSVSKQFCAACVLMLQEQGKLSISDTLDKYFPEYEHAKQITLKDMLAMRSGIPNPTEDLYDYVSVDSTEAENVEAIKKYVFEKPLDFEPDTSYAYSNTNYFLLANIIEQISGQSYNEFLRENILTPLKMTHTGTIIELGDSPAWTQGVEYKNIDLEPGLTKGAGDVISNAADMTTWLKALSSGKVVSEESYKAMTTDYSDGEGYGFGLRTHFGGGVGHPGNIGDYYSVDCIRSDENVTVFMSTNNAGTSIMTIFFSLMNEL